MLVRESSILCDPIIESSPPHELQTTGEQAKTYIEHACIFHIYNTHAASNSYLNLLLRIHPSDIQEDDFYIALHYNYG